MKVILGGRMEEPEVAIVGTKRQVVIPQRIRRELGIESKTRLAFYMRGDKLVLTKLKLPQLGEELSGLFERSTIAIGKRRSPLSGKSLKQFVRIETRSVDSRS